MGGTGSVELSTRPFPLWCCTIEERIWLCQTTTQHDSFKQPHSGTLPWGHLIVGVTCIKLGSLLLQNLLSLPNVLPLVLSVGCRRVDQYLVQYTGMYFVHCVGCGVHMCVLFSLPTLRSFVATLAPAGGFYSLCTLLNSYSNTLL